MSTAVDHTVRLPRSALHLLSKRLGALGPDGIRALREAGYRAGVELYSALGKDVSDREVARFFDRIDSLSRDFGLGRLEFHPLTPDLGAIAWYGTPEAAGSGGSDSIPRCYFVSGVLGGLLSRGAGRTVGVAEVRCHAGESEPCWFLFGSTDRVRAATGTQDRSSLAAALAT